PLGILRDFTSIAESMATVVLLSTREAVRVACALAAAGQRDGGGARGAIARRERHGGDSRSYGCQRNHPPGATRGSAIGAFACIARNNPFTTTASIHRHVSTSSLNRSRGGDTHRAAGGVRAERAHSNHCANNASQ